MPTTTTLIGEPVDGTAITSFPDLGGWAAGLRQVATGPLEFCPDFPAIARRHEAWWAGEAVDRPLILAQTNALPRRPITKRLDLLEDPEAWLAAKLADMHQIHRVGDVPPSIRVDFGPVSLGALLGAPVEFGADTTWTHRVIDDDWSNEPAWIVRDENRWWQRMRELLALTASDAAGRYIVCTPSAGGSADVLLNLRGAGPLCLDVREQPARIARAVRAIYPAWHRVFSTIYSMIVAGGAGLIHWIGLWSDVPYMVNECDFNFMIGPKEFDALFLPDIARQSATVGRAVFHLDGPGATRHIDSLLSLPSMTAIQFVAGAQTRSVLAYAGMLHKIQRAGRPLQIACRAEEVPALCDELQPEGLAFLVDADMAPDALDRWYAGICARYGCRA